MREDELYHWKYIKRERKNGRWVYYYDPADVGKRKRDYEQAKKDEFSAEIARRNAKSKYETERERMDEEKKEFMSKFYSKEGVSLDDYESFSDQSEITAESERRFKAADKVASEAGQRFAHYESQMMKHKVKDAVIETTSKMFVKVANFISSLFPKKDTRQKGIVRRNTKHRHGR